MKVSLVKEMRAVDRRAGEEYGLPEVVLMENAGRGAADALLARLDANAHVLCLGGPGQNGGDSEFHNDKSPVFVFFKKTAPVLQPPIPFAFTHFMAQDTAPSLCYNLL